MMINTEHSTTEGGEAREPQITRITREIPCRGIAYLIFRQCGAQALGEQLDREVRTMADLGAREIYADRKSTRLNSSHD